MRHTPSMLLSCHVQAERLLRAVANQRAPRSQRHRSCLPSVDRPGRKRNRRAERELSGSVSIHCCRNSSRASRPYSIRWSYECPGVSARRSAIRRPKAVSSGRSQANVGSRATWRVAQPATDITMTRKAHTLQSDWTAPRADASWCRGLIIRHTGRITRRWSSRCNHCRAHSSRRLQASCGRCVHARRGFANESTSW